MRSILILLAFVPLATAQIGVSVEVGDDIDASARSADGANVSIEADLPDPEIEVSSNGSSASAEARLWRKAADDGRYGSFSDEGQGSFVDLRVTSRALESIRVGAGTAFVARLDLGSDLARVDLDGPRLQAAFTGGRLQATDSASGSLRIDADQPVSLQIDLAPAAEADAASPRLVWLEAEGRSGALAIHGGGYAFTEGQRIHVFLEPGAILRFEAEAGKDWRSEQQAFASGRLGAELGIVADAQAHVSLVDSYTVDVSDIEARSGEASFVVESDNHSARAIHVELDASLFPEPPEMRFDGQLATRVSDAAAVHAASNATVPLYSLIEVDGVLHAAIHVPGFSAHEIAFASPAAADEPAAQESASAPGIVLVGGLAGAVAFLRRLR